MSSNADNVSQQISTAETADGGEVTVTSGGDAGDPTPSDNPEVQ